MKFTEEIERYTSGRGIADSGLSDTEAKVSPSVQKELLGMREHLEHFRNCLSQLQELGVDVSEPQGPDWIDDEDGIVGLGFLVSGVDVKRMKLSLLSIELGFHYGRLVEAFWASRIPMLRSWRGKDAGYAGGQGSKAKADPRHKKILDAFARWAQDPKNAKRSTANFADTFSKKNKNKRGFRESTIQEVIRKLLESIQEKRLQVAPSVSLTKAIAAVSKHLAGQPGVSEHTIRRALE